MNLRDYANEVRKRLELMKDNRAKDALVIAGDLKALIQLRIQSTGAAYTGSKFSPYNPGYKEIRQKKGAQVSYVDFTVTGQMWRNIRQEVIESSNTAVTVEITARDRANQAKLRGATVQPKGSPRGNILIPNAREIEIVQQANKDRVLKYMANA